MRCLLANWRRILPSAMMTLGSLLIANAAWPIIYDQFFVAPSLSQSELLIPIPESALVYNSIVPSSLATTPISTPGPGEVLGQEADFTKASNWFPTQAYQGVRESKITHYTITIPKVDVFDAVVEIGGEDLAKNLIQYPGTANPGQLGSPVIFGHSVLRQFYNPAKDNPKRYVSIFSKIMTLESGDEIFVDYDGIKYTYVVRDKFQVKPEDVYILQQRYNAHEMKLVTCVPEGTYLRRGVLVASLKEVGANRAN